MKRRHFTALALSSAASLSFAQPATPPASPPMRLRGTIEKVDGSTLTIKSRTGESLTDAIDGAVREKLSRLDAEARSTTPEPPLLERLQPLLDAIAAERKAKGDTRTSQELLDELYDEHGLPA